MGNNTRIVWKFTLRSVGVSTLAVPRGATPLSVDQQRQTLCVWMLCDPDEPRVARCVRVVETGEPLAPAESVKYIGTVQTDGQQLVYHVFDLGEHDGAV